MSQILRFGDSRFHRVRGSIRAGSHRINSVRKKDKGVDKIDSPEVKYFRASSGKEAMFDGEG
ncbi:hypothetical protein [Clostridium thailandense]|uniref:hypothetical protein n=1 Tax=Clostridium thailandense TaxID=2794346 RepID=UPI00398A0680